MARPNDLYIPHVKSDWKRPEENRLLKWLTKGLLALAIMVVGGIIGLEALDIMQYHGLIP